jgi:iron complex outermembrane receptor protein
MAAAAQAQTDASVGVPIESVVVTATRTEARAFDIPASIDRIDGDDVRAGRAQINLSESLGGVAGLLARDRQNYAQDVQISVRGFGARSTFGIRGVRLYVDGIPATLPDGQGQISNVELGSVSRIEVLRGPFSALYGNSSGGVIQIYTEEGSGPPRLGLSTAIGSDGVERQSVQVGGASGDFGWTAGTSHFRTDGFRDHSATDRNLGNARLTWRLDDRSKLTLVANSVNLPQAQDPLGLTRAQFDAGPRGVDPSALSFNTRKVVDQTQGGLVYERKLASDQTLQATLYGGRRKTIQYQAIAAGTQANPLHPGGVIDLARDYRGLDVRWSLKTLLQDAPLTVVAGLAYDALKEHRQGFQNFVGSVLGVKGAQRRDEINDVASTDPYVQGTWQITPQWSLNAGVRRSSVHFDSADHYVVGTNPDDSGGARYGATLPVVGVLFAATPEVHLYATAGRGFETPTLNELAYRPNGATGLNFGLQSATSNSIEGGVKTRLPGWGEFAAAIFQTGTDHEIVTQTNSGGRATFQNAGATSRKGLELSWTTRALGHLRPQLAYTALDATYRDGFTTCTSTPCAAANVSIPGGNSIPGVAKSSLYAALAWAPPTGWRGAVEARALSRVFVNDANTDAASGYAVAAANLGYVAPAGPWELSGFVRVDNLFARKYAGSVIVNEGNSRFFEPAPGRTWLASVSVSIGF